MIVQILGSGTSSGVPLPGCHCRVCDSPHERNKRSRTSAVVRLDDGRNILIDASTDLRWQALRWRIDNVNAVLFTHAHADHILGVDDLRSFNFIQHEAIPCFATKETADELRRFYPYIFTPNGNAHGGAVARLTMHTFEPLTPITPCGVPILPFPLMHGPTAVCGFKIGDLGYATDCNHLPAESLQILTGIETLVIDGLRYEPHESHLTIPEAIAIAERVGAKQTYIIHMSHAVDYEEVSAQLPPTVELAYDGLTIPVSLNRPASLNP